MVSTFAVPDFKKKKSFSHAEGLIPLSDSPDNTGFQSNLEKP